MSAVAQTIQEPPGVGEKDARIAELEAVIRDLCGATADAFLSGPVGDTKGEGVFHKVYREARRLGVFK